MQPLGEGILQRPRNGKVYLLGLLNGINDDDDDDAILLQPLQ